jgi:DNA-binding FadR family transcriptional regulator
MSQQANLVSSPDPSSPLAAVRRERVDEQIVRIVVDAVVAGQWPVGSTLPPERELAEQLQVNRTSLRQALARLEQIGLIKGRHGSGNVVQDPSGLTAPEVLRAMLRQLGPELFREILEVRTGLGPMIGRLAAERAEADEVAALRAALDDVEQATTPVARERAEMGFFLILVAATHNRVLASLVRWVEATYGQLPEEFAGAFADADAVDPSLRRIADAIARHKPGPAGKAVEQYFATSGDRLLQAALAALDDAPGT